MFPDERRTKAQLERQRWNEMISDREAFLRKYNGMVARLENANNREQELKRKLADSTKHVVAVQNELASFKKDVEEYKKKEKVRIDGALDAYRRESQRLKADLKHVRNSRTMKIGRVVLSPINFIRSIFKNEPNNLEPSGVLPLGAEPLKQLPGAPTPQVTAASKTDPATRPSSNVETREKSSASPSKSKVAAAPSKATKKRTGSTPAPKENFQESPLPVSQRSLETLKQEFADAPSAMRLDRVINRLWFQAGIVSEAAELISTNADLATQLPEQRRIFWNRITGAHQLISRTFDLPPRSLGTAYVPEPNRVLYCVNSTPIFNSNGYSTRTLGVAHGLRNSGADVVVAARAGYPWDTKADREIPAVTRFSTDQDEIRYVHTPGANLNRTPLDQYLMIAADAFTREARLNRPEIIQAASNFRTALPALIAARRVGVPFVYEVRGLWEFTEASAKEGWEQTERFKETVRLETLTAMEADVVLAITQQVADELIRRGVPSEKIILMENAVDPEVFLPLPMDVGYAKARKIPTDKPIIGFAGSIVDYEGLDDLLKASELLKDRNVPHQIVIAGSGQAAEGLRKLRNDLGLDTVMFLGRRPISEMPRLMSTFSITVCPRKSSTVTELVSPLKPLESFATQKAVVLSDVAPQIDLAGADQRRALTFRSGDPNDLADVLERLLKDPELQSNLGRAARLWICDERTWDYQGKRMRDAFQQADENYKNSCGKQKPLSEVRIGLIADEFTTKTIQENCTVIPLERGKALPSDLDLVFVESAWQGNGGQWNRGVGFYSEEEFADLSGILADAKQRGIPTVFWNKEDPIHFARFEKTASHFDHVFSTDANTISLYMATPGNSNKTVAAMPFYAQPEIHNPLAGSRPFSPTVAYAGTYYGDRYRVRSRQLYRLLATATNFGLTIFDRQKQFESSPYSFPQEFEQYVVGALPYDDVIDTYKAHIAHLNVNSVTDSPTMFSRRVVEIAACGGIVLSGPGRGVTETFGGLIPTSNDNAVWRAFLHDWSTSANERLREAWLQMRAIYRSHLADHALAIMLRTSGIPVEIPTLPSYGVILDSDSSEVAEALATQSVPPKAVFIAAGQDPDPILAAHPRIQVLPIHEIHGSSVEYIGLLKSKVTRTHFEDLLISTKFGNYDRISYRFASKTEFAEPIAKESTTLDQVEGLVRAKFFDPLASLDEPFRRPYEKSLTFLFATPSRYQERVMAQEIFNKQRTQKNQTILVAGHDLKFAKPLIKHFEERGLEVLIDQWKDHAHHDEEISRDLLNRADIVFCEWGLGNAVWYSKNISADQQLYVRVHSQELRRPYLSQINHSRVDKFIFVGQLIQRAAIESHGVPQERSLVIPNLVNVEELTLPKVPHANRTIGIVGIVPQTKRLDRAVTVIERLLKHDPTFRLRIKGKQPSDYPWMANRPDEMAYYGEVYDRIAKLNENYPGCVTFDGFGHDMADWYREVGYVLSVSDFESFHLTLPDGAVSGAVPLSLNWPGADRIYPRYWLFESTDEIADAILSENSITESDRQFVIDNFGEDVVTKKYDDLIFGA